METVYKLILRCVCENLPGRKPKGSCLEGVFPEPSDGTTLRLVWSSVGQPANAGASGEGEVTGGSIAIGYGEGSTQTLSCVPPFAFRFISAEAM